MGSGPKGRGFDSLQGRLTNMKREFSVGGIVFNQAGQVLLVFSGSRKYWGFPKGLVDPGQSAQEAALREVKEEGGVDAEIIEKVGDSQYVYTHPETEEKVFKVATFYLMKYLSGNPQDHDWEIAEAGFFSSEEALKKLKFSQDRKLLQKALRMLSENFSSILSTKE